jgi:hypothetical protein
MAAAQTTPWPLPHAGHPWILTLLYQQPSPTPRPAIRVYGIAIGSGSPNVQDRDRVGIAFASYQATYTANNQSWCREVTREENYWKTCSGSEPNGMGAYRTVSAWRSVRLKVKQTTYKIISFDGVAKHSIWGTEQCTQHTIVQNLSQHSFLEDHLGTLHDISFWAYKWRMWQVYYYNFRVTKYS